MGKPAGQLTPKQIEDRAQTLLWKKLSGMLHSVYADVAQHYSLTVQNFAHLRGNPVEVKVGVHSIYLRWNSSYKFYGSRKDRFLLTEARVAQFAEQARAQLIQRLNAMGCAAKRPALHMAASVKKRP